MIKSIAYSVQLRLVSSIRESCKALPPKLRPQVFTALKDGRVSASPGANKKD